MKKRKKGTKREEIQLMGNGKREMGRKEENKGRNRETKDINGKSIFFLPV